MAKNWKTPVLVLLLAAVGYSLLSKREVPQSAPYGSVAKQVRKPPAHASSVNDRSASNKQNFIEPKSDDKVKVSAEFAQSADKSYFANLKKRLADYKKVEDPTQVTPEHIVEAYTNYTITNEARYYSDTKSYVTAYLNNVKDAQTLKPTAKELYRVMRIVPIFEVLKNNGDISPALDEMFHQHIASFGAANP